MLYKHERPLCYLNGALVKSCPSVSIMEPAEHGIFRGVSHDRIFDRDFASTIPLNYHNSRYLGENAPSPYPSLYLYLPRSVQSGQAGCSH